MTQERVTVERRLQAPSLAVAALIVAAGFLGSRLLGLLRSIIIAHSFGTSPELDAFWVGIRLPDLTFQLISGATLASAFIPTFALVKARNGAAEAWRLTNSVLNLVLVATIVFAVVAFVLAPAIVPLMAPGLGEGTGREEELRDLAVELTRIMLASAVLFSASGMFMGVLNANRRFLTPALAPMLYNGAIILAALLSDDVKVLAFGVVAGAAAHFAVQLPDLRLAGMTYRFVADWKDAAVRQVGRLMAPRVLGLAATQVNFYFVAIFFASTISAGAISAVSFAWLVVMTPLGIVGMAIATAAFPTLADQAAREDAELPRTLARTLRLILFLSLPAGVGLALLAKPLVVVLLQRGEFGVDSTDLTAQAVVFYAPALFAHASIEILSRGFYALGDTKTPVAIAVGAMVLNVALAAALVGPLEVEGLALALSLATAIEAGALAFALRKRVPAAFGEAAASATTRMLVATALLAAVVVGVRLGMEEGLSFEVAHQADALAVLAAATAAGGLAFLGMSLALRLEEPREVVARLRRRNS